MDDNKNKELNNGNESESFSEFENAFKAVEMEKQLNNSTGNVDDEGVQIFDEKIFETNPLGKTQIDKKEKSDSIVTDPVDTNDIPEDVAELLRDSSVSDGEKKNDISAPKEAEVPEKGENDDEKKKKKRRKRKPHKEHVKARKVFTVLLSIALFFLVTACICGGYVLYHANNFISGDVAIDLSLYKQNQSQTTILYTTDSEGNETEIARLHGEQNRIWVNIDKIPKNLQNAYIALEDKRFRQHSGVDWIRTISVVVKHHFAQGGSTITQQLIKNLTGEGSRIFSRKYNEILNALNLERHYSKDTILEAYLNTLYLDGGCYGVETAAEYYFGKNVSELNLAECACIAAITQAPYTYDPLINPDNNRERQLVCLQDMLYYGMIDEKEYNEAKDYKMIFTNSEEYKNSKRAEENEENEEEEEEEDEEINSYYVDYVIDQVINDLVDILDYSYDDAWRLVYYGGLKIHVAEDPKVQKIMERVYENREGFPDSTSSHGELPQSCMVIMDYTGRVVGIVGQAGEKTVNRGMNYATDSVRQPGSSIKPLSVYSYAVEKGGYSWSFPLIQNYGIQIEGSRWPFNFGGDAGAPNSYETIQQALAPSHNTVPVRILQDVGVSNCYSWLKYTFHMTSLTPEDESYAPLGVGAMTNGVYPIEMCAAYVPFGNMGKYYKPYSYYSVTNNDGSKVYLTHADEGEQIIEKSTAEVMNKLLQTVESDYNGTANGYGVDGFEMFAKTGTTTDEKDRWFIGGTPYYVATVWMGYAEYPEALNFSVNYCGRIYRDVMNEIHSSLREKEFEFDDDIVQLSYCRDTGMIANSSCKNTSWGWYKRNSIPDYCDGVGRVVGEGVRVIEEESSKPGEGNSEESSTKPTTEQGETKPTTSQGTTKPTTEATTVKPNAPTAPPVTAPTRPSTTKPTTAPTTQSPDPEHEQPEEHGGE